MAGDILVLNGPNLNLLGTRQPEVYGHDTLDDVIELCRRRARDFGLAIDARQSNHEGVLIDWIHAERQNAAGIVINPGGLAHTSIVLRDALVTVECPVVEVHISNVHAREEYRHHSYLTSVVDGVIAGLGVRGYPLAVEYLAGRVA